jgi:heat shock protein 5
VATAGDTHLGGEDFDSRVMEYLINNTRGRLGPISQRTFGKLKHEDEETKQTLSSQQSTRLEIEILKTATIFGNPDPRQI